MSRETHEPDEAALTEAARRKLEEDNREAEDRPMGPVGGVPSRAEAERRADEAGLTEAAMPGQGPTADDAAPETLLPDDGARSAAESNERSVAADAELQEVGPGLIGGGDGLDEAELGRAKPLDGKPWDGDPDQPLQPESVADRPLTAPPGDEPEPD